MVWFNQDWKQYKKNLENERKAWDEFENKKSNLKGEATERIDQLRILKETEMRRIEEEFKKERKRLEDEAKEKIKKAHAEYMKKVEKKFKPSIGF